MILEREESTGWVWACSDAARTRDLQARVLGRGERRPSGLLLVGGIVLVVVLVLTVPKVVLGVLASLALVVSLVDAQEPAMPEPRVVVFVPVFQGIDAHDVIGRLTSLRYPSLDVTLVFDEDAAEELTMIDLPGWVRAVIVPRDDVRATCNALEWGCELIDVGASL